MNIVDLNQYRIDRDTDRMESAAAKNQLFFVYAKSFAELSKMIFDLNCLVDVHVASVIRSDKRWRATLHIKKAG